MKLKIILFILLTSLTFGQSYDDLLLKMGGAAVVIDTIPAAFTFTDITGANFSTVYTSNGVVPDSFDNASVYAGGGSYKIGALGSWVTAYGTVTNGDTVFVKLTSGSTPSSTVTVTLTIGGVSDAYSVTTNPDLVTSFTNGTTYAYETFTTNGDTIISAINTTGFGGCVSNAISVTTGQVYKVTYSGYVLNSGSVPLIYIVDTNNGAASGLSNTKSFLDASGFLLTVTGTDAVAYLQINRDVASNFTVRDVDMVLVNP